MVESESLFLKKKQDSSDKDDLDEYNSYLIRKLINFIRRQLENRKNNHPIYNIINKFSEIYSNKINDYYKSVEDDEEKIENKKIEIIKDIQNFIDIMVKALKLFYMKSINYDIFKCYEQDDFINLICYFLFNDQKFEQNLFNFFELSNRKKQIEFNNKKETILKDITPGELGIKEEFRLNEDTERFKKNERNNKKNNIIIKTKEEDESDEKKEDIGIIKHTKNSDKEIEQEKNNKTNERDDKVHMNSFSIERKINSPFDKKNIRNIKTIEENYNNKKFGGARLTYEEFFKNFNSLIKKLKEQYQEDSDNNPSNIIYPNSEEFKYDPNKPYQDAIDYIETIREYKAPLDKLTIIALVSPIINDCISNCWKDAKDLNIKLELNADQISYIYTYIFSKMKIDSILTYLDLINYFIGIESKQDKIGYLFTKAKLAVEFIMSIKSKEDLLIQEKEKSK